MAKKRKNSICSHNQTYIDMIKRSLNYEDVSYAELGRRYGVRWQTIQAISSGKTWKDV